ncbi:MAG: TIGR02253 family HAD-type hydrolase [bacterium]
MIKALIFDLDNTLIDFVKMKKYAVESAVDAMIDAGLNIPKEQMVERIYEVYEQEGIEDQKIFDKTLESVLGQINFKILAAGIFGYRKSKESNLNTYPHVRLSLTELTKMGMHMAILSDAPRMQAWVRIYSLGLADYFDEIIAYEDTGERKPSPKPFEKVLSLLRVDSTEVLMIGDWVERDIVGAKSVGIKTVYARYGDVKKSQNPNSDYEITDILQLIDIVKKENR